MGGRLLQLLEPPELSVHYQLSAFGAATLNNAVTSPQCCKFAHFCYMLPIS